MLAGPVTVAVGDSLPLSVSAREPSGRPSHWWVGWFKHQGPGEVVFASPPLRADPSSDYRATTTATFGEPGTYVLRVQAIENINSFERHCCWTNGYVEVLVTP